MVQKRTKNESKGVYRDLEPDSHPNLGAAQGFLGVFRPVLAHCLQCYQIRLFALYDPPRGSYRHRKWLEGRPRGRPRIGPQF